jgi:hypothetical protein
MHSSSFPSAQVLVTMPPNPAFEATLASALRALHSVASTSLCGTSNAFSARATLSLLRRRQRASCWRKSSRCWSTLNSFTAIIVRAASVGVSLVTGKAGAAKFVQSSRRATVEPRSFICPCAPAPSHTRFAVSTEAPASPAGVLWATSLPVGTSAAVAQLLSVGQMSNWHLSLRKLEWVLFHPIICARGCMNCSSSSNCQLSGSAPHNPALQRTLASAPAARVRVR